MGYMAHHAVVVYISGYVYSGSTRHDALIPDIEGFRDSLPESFRHLVIGPIPTAINGDFTAVFLPDGSKEGWPDSERGDTYRQQFIDLFAFRHEDGSSPFDVAVIRFGGDEPELAQIYQPDVSGTPPAAL